MKLGLVGKSLEHSFSKKYFSKKFKTKQLHSFSYENFEIEDIRNIHKTIKNKDLEGFNVTIPYKEKIIPFLDKIDSTAENIGAVNTVKIIRKEKKIKLIGYNTDYFGFHQLIKPFFKPQHERVLILGTGGASKSVAYLLKNKYGVDILYASRKPTSGNIINWNDINDNVIKFYKMIVNTTPLGTFPNVNLAPNIPVNKITKEHLFVDLVYNPKETLFLKKAKEKGATTINGLTMLHQQAEKSWQIWTNDNCYKSIK